MFHMLSYFDLRPGVSVEVYNQAMVKLAEHLVASDLIVGIDPLGRRQRDTILDTDGERDQEFFLMMHFKDKVQSDRAVHYIEGLSEPGGTLHSEMYQKLTNSVFVCWQDIDLDRG